MFDIVYNDPFIIANQTLFANTISMIGEPVYRAEVEKLLHCQSFRLDLAGGSCCQ